MKKCPYCAEEIQDEALVCKHCGRDLTKERPEVTAERRVELTKELADLETKLPGWERNVAEHALLAQQAGRQVTWALVGILVGVFLVPVFGLGLILIIAGILAALTQSGKRRAAESAQTEARKNIEMIRTRIVEVKTQLAALS